MSLENVFDILEEISNVSSRKEKEKIIQSYKDAANFKKVVFYALDYNKVFNAAFCNFTPEDTMECSIDDIFNYLDFMSSRDGLSIEEKTELYRMASFHGFPTVNVISRILKKDLKCGASVKTFQKIFNDLPFFEMMTCKDDPRLFLKNAGDKSIFWSSKKDGVRVWGVNVSNKVYYYSRSGLRYRNFSTLDKEIRILSNKISEISGIPFDTPIDGEATVIDGNFREVMKNVRTLEEMPDVNWEFNVFDIATDRLPFEKRYEILEKAFESLNLEKIKLLKHTKVEDATEEKLREIMKSAVENGDEGIVVKIGFSPYEFKEKSKFWLKMKPVETLDLLVVGTYKGRYGKKYSDSLGGLIVKYKDNKVRVG